MMICSSSGSASARLNPLSSGEGPAGLPASGPTWAAPSCLNPLSSGEGPAGIDGDEIERTDINRSQSPLKRGGPCRAGLALGVGATLLGSQSPL